MIRTAFAALAGATLVLAACSNATPQEKHELGCAAGTLTGAVLGGLVGSAFGKGGGHDLMVAAGAGAGAGLGTLACKQ
ncbi:hypothetical protein [Amaricoccus solimangrovi]|uniref:17 kDa surface antigen n=1 Tax=Amaricoccus solimangrovi TaxID=2589815 RepID=A0A501WQ91_9RHOB|nr:hypothetical protein [Amaricoccus solimangrovi]TPE47946.1 hypothetical protein FJM51_18905 [Amaricoccus solimangrovi]